MLAAVGALVVVGLLYSRLPLGNPDSGMMPEVVVTGKAPESLSQTTPEVVVRPADSSSAAGLTAN